MVRASLAQVKEHVHIHLLHRFQLPVRLGHYERQRRFHVEGDGKLGDVLDLEGLHKRLWRLDFLLRKGVAKVKLVLGEFKQGVGHICGHEDVIQGLDSLSRRDLASEVLLHQAWLGTDATHSEGASGLWRDLDPVRSHLEDGFVLTYAVHTRFHAVDRSQRNHGVLHAGTVRFEGRPNASWLQLFHGRGSSREKLEVLPPLDVLSLPSHVLQDHFHGEPAVGELAAKVQLCANRVNLNHVGVQLLAADGGSRAGGTEGNADIVSLEDEDVELVQELHGLVHVHSHGEHAALLGLQRPFSDVHRESRVL